jgi:hypothetical protein
MMMRVRRQTVIRELDVTAIKQLAAGCDSNKHCRVAVLDDADSCGSLRGCFCHAFLLRGHPKSVYFSAKRRL